MIPFTLHRAVTVEDAMNVAVRHTGARWVAGGTTLVDLMKLGVEAPDVLIDLNGLDLAQIEPLEGGVRIGALARMADAAAHPLVAERVPLLAETLLAGASPQLRNMATIGGNLMQRTRCPYFRDTTWTACNKRRPGSGCAALAGPSAGHAILGTSNDCIATHPADLPVALSALGASVNVAGVGGATRRVALDALHVAYGEDPAREHVLEPGELITSVDIPARSAGEGWSYVKARGRASFEFALAAAAVVLKLDGDEIRTVRVGLGGLATRPWRSHEAETALVGRPPTEGAFRTAADAALAGAVTRPDNAYKLELGRRTLVRALGDACARVPR